MSVFEDISPLCTFFIHIPKTGGSTLRSIISKKNNTENCLFLDGVNPLKSINELLETPPVYLKKTNLIYGHMDYGIHQHINKKPVYLTMLRHPVERVISHYFYAKQHKIHILHNTINDNEMDIETFVSSGLTTESDNLQVRMLTGTSFYGNNEIPFGACDEELLNRAIYNLKNKFLAFGILEKFDWSALLFGLKMGWGNMAYLRHNSGGSERQSYKTTPTSYAHIASTNKYDMQLYDWAVKYFLKKIKIEIPFLKIRSTLLSSQNIILKNASQAKQRIFPCIFLP